MVHGSWFMVFPSFQLPASSFELAPSLASWPHSSYNLPMRLPVRIFEIAALPYDLMTAHPLWTEHCASMADHFPPAQSGRRLILDLGCGPGVSTRAMADACPNDKVIGLDYAAHMLQRARTHDSSLRSPLLRGDAHRLPFRDGCADAVTGHSFLYLLRDRNLVLQEIRRVLKPQGRLILMEPTRQDTISAVRAVGKVLFDWGPHLAFTMAAWRVAARTSEAFRPGELGALLTAEGFQVRSVDTTLKGLGWLAVAAPDAVVAR